MEDGSSFAYLVSRTWRNIHTIELAARLYMGEKSDQNKTHSKSAVQIIIDVHQLHAQWNELFVFQSKNPLWQITACKSQPNSPRAQSSHYPHPLIPVSKPHIRNNESWERRCNWYPTSCHAPHTNHFPKALFVCLDTLCSSTPCLTSWWFTMGGSGTWAAYMKPALWLPAPD